VALFYVLLSAPFIAMSQISVYAGAIMVLFLFVIMLLGTELLPRSGVLPWQRPVAVVLALLLAGEAAYLLFGRGTTNGSIPQPVETFGSPQAVGRALFNEYLLPLRSIHLLLGGDGGGHCPRRDRGERQMVPDPYHSASAILFTIGTLGVLIRRNPLIIFMSIELMLNAGNLAMVAFTRTFLVLEGQIFVFFVMTVAAAEVAVGLALIVTIFRTRHTINIDLMNSLKG
jgi:NADH-quinone oxidoreductase subunit K